MTKLAEKPAQGTAKPTDADRETALAWVASGDTAAAQRARAADTARWPDSHAQARAYRRADAIASLEAEGWTPATALAAIRDTSGTALRALHAVRTQDGHRSAALLFLAHDFAPFPGVNAGTDRAIAVIAELRAQGWTPRSAAAAIRRADGDTSAALRSGPPAPLRVVRGGGESPETAPRPALRLVTMAGAR